VKIILDLHGPGNEQGWVILSRPKSLPPGATLFGIGGNVLDDLHLRQVTGR
jgi:hypothetical protein